MSADLYTTRGDFRLAHQVRLGRVVLSITLVPR